MSLIVRLFVIALALIAASLVAGCIVVFAILYPELSALDAGSFDPNAFNVLIGFGFVFVSGFALIPALIIVVVTEAFAIRSALAYALGGAAVGAACYLGLVPFNTETMRFEGIVQRHLEILVAAGIVAGLVYWLIAGRKAGAWRRRAPRLHPDP